MKTTLCLLSALAMFAFAAVPSVHAQHNIDTIVSAGTNNVAANATNTYATLIVATKGSKIAIQPVFSTPATGSSSNAFFYLDGNIDGSTNWDFSLATLAVAANGTNPVTKTLSVTADGIAYYRLRIGNSNSVPLTNVQVKVSQKSGF